MRVSERERRRKREGEGEGEGGREKLKDRFSYENNTFSLQLHRKQFDKFMGELVF